MSNREKFLREFVVAVQRVKDRPFSQMTRRMARSTIAAYLVPLLGPGQKPIDVYDYVEIEEGKRGEMSPIIKIPSQHSPLVMELSEALPDFYLKTEGETMILSMQLPEEPEE